MPAEGRTSEDESERLAGGRLVFSESSPFGVMFLFGCREADERRPTFEIGETRSGGNVRARP
jgi:hypothetical protein